MFAIMNAVGTLLADSLAMQKAVAILRERVHQMIQARCIGTVTNPLARPPAERNPQPLPPAYLFVTSHVSDLWHSTR